MLCNYFMAYILYIHVYLHVKYVCVCANFCCYNECTELPIAKHGFLIKISVSGNCSDRAAVSGLLH